MRNALDANILRQSKSTAVVELKARTKLMELLDIKAMPSSGSPTHRHWHNSAAWCTLRPTTLPAPASRHTMRRPSCR